MKRARQLGDSIFSVVPPPCYNVSTESGGLPMRREENNVKKTIDLLNRKIAFLKPGWWLVHLVGVAAVYATGRFLAGGR